MPIVQTVLKQPNRIVLKTAKGSEWIFDPNKLKLSLLALISSNSVKKLITQQTLDGLRGHFRSSQTNRISPLQLKGELTAQQNHILNFALQSHRPLLFFTGEAGTGKVKLFSIQLIEHIFQSFLLKKIISALENEHPESAHEKIAVTGTSGMAAVNIHGRTCIDLFKI